MPNTTTIPITQADVDKAKAAMDLAKTERESFWNGTNPSGFSVMSLLSILKTCNSANDVTRNDNGDAKSIIASSQPNCPSVVSSGALLQLGTALSNYATAQNIYLLKKKVYDTYNASVSAPKKVKSAVIVIIVIAAVVAALIYAYNRYKK